MALEGLVSDVGGRVLNLRVTRYGSRLPVLEMVEGGLSMGILDVGGMDGLEGLAISAGRGR